MATMPRPHETEVATSVSFFAPIFKPQPYPTIHVILGDS
jgi:hypothetical protein